MSGDAKYFSTTKKGEIRELQEDLNSVNKIKITEAVKKVIAAMTVGKDVSMLFTDVIKSMGTDNIELKKLVYLYIINYARSQPEKAILVVSMFIKDSTTHPNPLIRALALRTMGCIRVNRIAEYLCDPLAVCLRDRDPYVRKTAAICVAKFYDLDPELVEERGFIDLLRNLLSDVNPMVVANAVAALTEICETSGIDYFKIDNGTLSKLLTALNECTEWGRVFILEALSKFNAKGNQACDICDRVVPQLAHANSAVVMAAVKVVIKFLDILPKKNDVERYCKKLAAPLMTLLSSPPEIEYVALRNIDLIIQKYPQIFANDVRIFYVKYNDEPYIKQQKLDILEKLASHKNAKMILQEFEQYAQEVDVDFVKRSVRGIGRIAIKLDEVVADQCVHVLSELVKTRVDYIVQESVITIKDIFRRYPGKYEKIIVTLCDNLESLTEPKAKASMIWIIGEYAERIIDAQDRLDHFIDSFDSEGSMVQLQLLTASVKLFLKKPEKAKGLIKKVLNLATESSDNPDLRDRAFVYWRLLSTDPSAARKVVLAEKPKISRKTTDYSQDYLSSLLDNISSLSSVYHCKPDEFVRNAKNVSFMPFDIEEENSSDDEEETDESSTSSSEDEDEEEEEVKAKEPEIAAPTTQQATFNIFEELPFSLELGMKASNDDGFEMVFDSNKGDGLEMSVGFKRNNNNSSVMRVKCANKGNEVIQRIDLKFNKNYLGIQPISTLPLKGEIKPGQTQIVDVQLKLMQPPTVRNALDLTVQMAARCVMRNRSKVVMFAAKVPSQIFFDDRNDAMVKDKSLYLSEWRAIQSFEQQIFAGIEDKVRNIENVKDVFRTNSFLFVSTRNVANRGVSLYFTTQLKDISVLLELSIANNGKCRVMTKSRDKYLSNIVCNAGVSILQSELK